MFSARVEAALTMAARRHDGQVRKVSRVPYLTHLVHVARIVVYHGYDEDHEVVALLHDVLEDTCRDEAEIAQVAEQIGQEFGPQVQEAVHALSEPKHSQAGEALSWKLRKTAYIDGLSTASALALVVSAADKTHNIATLLHNLRSEGPALWQRFRGGPEQSLWFYQSVVDVLEARMPNTAIVAELRGYTDALQQGVQRSKVS